MSSRAPRARRFWLSEYQLVVLVKRLAEVGTLQPFSPGDEGYWRCCVLFVERFEPKVGILADPNPLSAGDVPWFCAVVREVEASFTYTFWTVYSVQENPIQEGIGYDELLPREVLEALAAERKENRKEYNDRPEVRAKDKERRSSEYDKQRRKEYAARPEVKEKFTSEEARRLKREYDARPEIKARRKSEKAKQRVKEYEARPEVKARRKELRSKRAAMKREKAN
ncbi:hypothetical protein B0I37DRAFT_352023 [Chaetomium sp. MPI-CAGE-AT-0009]|nr:hypothetical protein B0I37DRAFT_352023 [Chaetomium sp. MPI-CAGE-AT-0009]